MSSSGTKIRISQSSNDSKAPLPQSSKKIMNKEPFLFYHLRRKHRFCLYNCSIFDWSSLLTRCCGHCSWRLATKAHNQNQMECNFTRVIDPNVFSRSCHFANKVGAALGQSPNHLGDEHRWFVFSLGLAIVTALEEPRNISDEVKAKVSLD